MPTGQFRLSIFYAGLDEDQFGDRMTFYRNQTAG